MPRPLPVEIPSGVHPQVRLACAVIETRLASVLRAIHLFGSAVDGGLKPSSDIDLLVTINGPLDDAARRALMRALLTVSAPPGMDAALRPLEVTVVAHDEVVPWRYPARRELQFGEWLRDALLAEVFEPSMPDPDLAILLTKARKHALTLAGPPANVLFDPVPEDDRLRAFSDALALWRSPSDWAGDERNVVLTLARIWYSVATGRIATKDGAADWVLARLPGIHWPVLRHARSAYLGQKADDLPIRPDQLDAFITFARDEVATLLASRQAGGAAAPSVGGDSG